MSEEKERIKALEIKHDNTEANLNKLIKTVDKYCEKHSEAEDVQNEKLTKHHKDLSWMKRIGAFFIALISWRQL